MHQRLLSQSVLLWMVAVAVMLLIGFGLSMALGRVLAAMGDAGGSRVLDYLGLGLGSLFVFDLILLILVLAVHALAEESDRPEQRP
jgi:hypothetical protein